MMRRARACFLATTALAAVATACAPKSSDSGGGPGSGGSTASPSQSDGGPSGAGGSNSGAGGLSGDLNGSETQTGGKGGALSEDAACKGLSAGAESITTMMPAPVAIYIVLDNSGSMDDCQDGTGGRDGCMTGPSKWDGAVEAITDFVSDPDSAGIDVAMQYFHPVGVGNNPDECDGVAHATAAVPMGPLPDNATAMTTSLAGTGPANNTPTVGALTGGTQYCAAFQAQHPDEKCVVVLVTDGQPNGCGLDSGNGNNVDPASEGILSPIAASAFAGGVTTFTIGMAGVSAAGFALLDAVARAGGSDCTPPSPGGESCDVSMSGSQGFLDALNAIRDTITITETTTLPCEWEIPSPPDGKKFDPELVNVAFEADVGGSQSLGNVPTEGACAGVPGGWYYDSVTDPSRIIVCPQTCDTITAIPNARVDVLFGCATEPAIFQ